jgi:hypothetical protein
MATSTDQNKPDARVLAEARAKIAGLLAIAYRRLMAAKRTVPSQPELDKHGLANSSHSSVHGVVP